MTKPKLTNWVKTGYPYLKERANIPSWVLPEHGFSRMVDQVGDNAILETCRPLGLAGDMERLSAKAPEPDSVSAHDWQQAASRWPYLSQASSLINAFMELCGPLQAHLPSIKTRIDPMAVYRCLAVLLFAPFIEQGKALMADLGEILHTPADHASAMLRSYAAAVLDSDIDTLDKVNRSIVKYSIWREWASELQKQALNCQYTPKLVAVTPAPSPDLIGLLAMIIKGDSHGPAGDSPKRTGRTFIAQ
ncbi:hypothetical protein ACFLXC_03235 [Chloroflexota bacterium]